MKKSLLTLFVLVVIALVVWGFSEREIAVAPITTNNPSENYSNPIYKFSLDLPTGYTIDENYVHQITPDQNINGVSFTIPESMADGTNLGQDTALSVESLRDTPHCTANLFTDSPQKPETIKDGNTTYSMLSSTDAGAGNRYEETIYAIPGSSPCTAIRYFVHYAAIENFPDDTVKEFDHKALINQFDAIRRSLKMK